MSGDAEDPSIEIHASFFPVGLDPTVRYRFRRDDWPKPGANGLLLLGPAGASWKHGHVDERELRSWSVGWDEIDSIEALPMGGYQINSNLRLYTSQGVVEMAVATIDVDPVLEVAKAYLRPSERDE